MNCHTFAFSVAFSTLLAATAAQPAFAQNPPGEEPALGTNRITQLDITGGGLTLQEIRLAGQTIFSTPFNKLDGYGDGPLNPADPTPPGHRPTLQDNGTFLRVNGLDGQTCIECHSVGSNAEVPFRFGVGGVGGAATNAIFQPTEIDVDASSNGSFAFFNGRYINPPFLFGSGGVELAGKEMTSDLQALKAQAQATPGVPVVLETKRVNFGTITFNTGTGFDLTDVRGVDEDLVVRPFGRKGEFATVRGFDLGAMEFHFGMQPVELVGADVDGDNDGVANEVLVGEISALHVFNTNLERPTAVEDPQTILGFQAFRRIGCADCHKPALHTTSTVLTYAEPEVGTDPSQNVFYSADISTSPAGFETNNIGGVKVGLFSDLKRHRMGPALAESFGNPLDNQFITARLWGVADTAPYLHDGRATTLTEAILLHGGEATRVRDAFDAMPDAEKVLLLGFLRSLKTPVNPAADL
jgi:hypothetical protein